MVKEGDNSIWQSPFARHGRKAYLFAAAALAVFVFVLAIGRLRTGQMVATATLRHEIPSGSAENGSMRPVDAGANELLTVRQGITADEAIETLLTSLPSPIAAKVEPHAASPQARIDAVRAQFEFTLAEDAQGDRATGVDVGFLHADGAVARTMANNAAQSFARRELAAAEATLYRNPHEEARQAASEARKAWEAAERAFDSFVDANQQQLDLIRNAAATSRSRPLPEQPVAAVKEATASTNRPQDEADKDSDGPWLADPNLVGSRYATVDSAPTAEAKEPVASPKAEEPVSEEQVELARLDADLAELNKIKAELLSTVTPNHPMVKELNGRIDKLTEQLERFRELVASREQEREREALAAEEAVVAQLTMSDEERTALLSEHQRLRSAADARKAEHRRLEAVTQDYWLRQMDERRVPRWQVTEADRATMRHEPTSLAMTLLALAMGLTAGAGLLLTASVSSPGFNSVEAAEDALPVPVVGKLPGDGAPHENPRKRSIGRLLLLGCEFSLAVFLAAMIIAVLLDGDFAETVRRDPLAALSDGWRRLLSLWPG